MICITNVSEVWTPALFFSFFPPMVFYQVIIVSVLHFRNFGGMGGQESMVQPKDTCPAVPLALPPSAAVWKTQQRR